MEKKKSIQELVKDPVWQKTRKSLLKKWNEKPEWCCEQLRLYLDEPIRKASEDKLRIVMNYLVGSGFRMGKIKHKCITQLRGEISAELKIRKFKK